MSPEQQEFKKRFTAYRLSIGMLINAKKLFEQERFRAVRFNDKDISRINLIATVVDKFTSDSKPYASITLDDNTGIIRAKVFADDLHMLKDIQIGDTILVIGLLREFNNELYILPEIIKTLDPRWLLARKLELINEYGRLYETTKTQVAGVELSEESYQVLPENEKIIPEKIEIQLKELKEVKEKNLREKLLEMIQEAEEKGGLEVDQLILNLKEPPEQINKEIRSLLEEGSIFEPKPGVLRIL
ncbi:MAG: OB-fold nucleic acid binding domain-containing protein [Candidatus Pacearchaeota archaeon]